MKEWLVASWTGIVFGLAVGWLVLPQPAWVQAIHAKIIAWARSKA